MMKKGVNVSLFWICLFFTTSCLKEIKVNLNDSDSRLVIEAELRANDSTVNVIISRTTNYFEPDALDLVNDASVVIWEENGASVSIPFVGAGKYNLTGFGSTYGKKYTIQVVHNGQEYRSSCDLLPPLTLLEPKIEILPGNVGWPGGFGEDGEPFFGSTSYWIYYRFLDPPGVGNCYKIIHTHNGIRYDELGQWQLGTDRFTDGNSVERPLLNFFNSKDTVLIELQSITQPIYNYYQQLQDAAYAATNAAISNPDFMWTNDALGFFSAYGYELQLVIIPEDENEDE